MLIEVAETHPPQTGKKVAHVVAAGGQKFEIWPEKLAAIQVGRTYEITVAEREFNGRTIRKITQARPAGVNGATAPAAGGGFAAGAAAESEFVGRILAALILKGEVRYVKRELYDAAILLRNLWAATCGGRAENTDAAGERH
jgi:hypothetical protein